MNDRWHRILLTFGAIALAFVLGGRTHVYTIGVAIDYGANDGSYCQDVGLEIAPNPGWYKDEC
jgi:hypothetical protein